MIAAGASTQGQEPSHLLSGVLAVYARGLKSYLAISCAVHLPNHLILGICCWILQS